MSAYREEVDTAVDIAFGAGGILRKHFGKLRTVEMKGRRDWCTVADTESDTLIRDEITKRFPDDDFISEESDPLDRGSPRKWIIDSCDGTWAFTRGFPIEVPSVSIAFANQGEPVVGVVFAPLLGEGEMYVAEKGQGVYRDTTRIRVNPSEDLNTATINHDIGKKDRWRIADVTKKLLGKDGVMASPSFGGSASALARVASGVLHGSATIGLDIWDVSGAVVLLREAGAAVTDLSGKPWHLGSESLLTANPRLHEKLLKIING